MATTSGVPAAIIRLEGTFDLPSARLVAYSLKRMSPGDAVRVDFSRVRQFHDFAIAVLAQALTSAEAMHVKVEGLGTHHVRLLRYFGVSADVFRASVRATRTPGGP
jgi:hypothetical protein